MLLVQHTEIINNYNNVTHMRNKTVLRQLFYLQIIQCIQNFRARK